MGQWSAIRFLNEREAISRSRNRLPHWQQDGGCYFVTFRLADSLPSTLLARLRRDRDEWRRDHPGPWDAATELDYHRRFSAEVDQWLDAGHGECRLARSETAAIVAGALGHFDTERHLLHAFVVMPNHVHVLASPGPGEELKRLVNSWKSYTARRINTLDGRSGALWQRGYFDRLIRDEGHFRNVVDYIRRNAGQSTCARLYLAPWVDDG